LAEKGFVILFRFSLRLTAKNDNVFISKCYFVIAVKRIRESNPGLKRFRENWWCR